MDKIHWLQRHGYLHSVDGGPCASLKGLALLGSVDIHGCATLYGRTIGTGWRASARHATRGERECRQVRHE